MREPDALLEIAEKGVKRALQLGAEGAEAYVQEVQTSKVVASGRLLSPTSSCEIAIGLRIALDGRVASSGASSPARIDAAIEEALRGIRGVGPASRVFSFAAPRQDALPRVSPAALDPEPGAQTGFVAEVVDAALADPRVSFVDCRVVGARRRLAIANSRGLAAWDETVGHRVEAEVRCSRGALHRGGREAAFLAAPVETQLEPARWIGEVVARVAASLDARPLEGGPVPEAIFHSVAASQILGMAAPVLAARQDRLAPAEKPLYSPLVTIRDEPRGPTGVRRRNIDDEGVPTAPLALVEKGLQVGLMHDAQTAARAGVAPTGHGMRAMSSGGVAPHAVNLVMEPGRASFEDLVRGAERAVIVAEPFLGGFTSNQATGDFSVVVPYALVVERGEIRHALGPTTIGGNAHEVLAQVREVGRDLRAGNAAVAPAFRAGGVSCAA